MDNHQHEEQSSKKKNVVFGIAAIGILAIVSIISYYAIKKIQNHSGLPMDIAQELFEDSPEASNQAQADCILSARKIYAISEVEAAFTEYKTHAENCREIYFAIDDNSGASKFRREGMYGDLIVDLALLAAETDKKVANEILDYGKSLKPWEFYLGPVSCDAHHVLDAYRESMNFAEEKICANAQDFKEKLIAPLQAKNFSILGKALSDKEVIWLGQPDSDVGCPEKLSTIISLLNKLLAGNIKVDESQNEMNETEDLMLSAHIGNEEKAIFVFRPIDGCLQTQSVLVPSVEPIE